MSLFENAVKSPGHTASVTDKQTIIQSYWQWKTEILREKNLSQCCSV